MTGRNAEAHGRLVREVRSRGHAVGSHSYSHVRSWESSSVLTVRDYVKGHRTLERILGERVRLFRPPYGHDDSRAWLTSIVMRSKWVHWTCDPLDWEPGARCSMITAAVEKELRPGVIVLLHDAIFDNASARDRTATLQAVDLILDRVEAMGLRSEAIR
jgi:peptidoglycan-N-acetylglucosamine deacetylase